MSVGPDLIGQQFTYNQYSFGAIADPSTNPIVYTEVQPVPVPPPQIPISDLTLDVQDVTQGPNGETIVSLSAPILSLLAGTTESAPSTSSSASPPVLPAVVIGNGPGSILLEGKTSNDGTAINFIMLLTNDASQQPGVNNTIDVPNESAGVVYQPACFASGTRVRTARGDIAVENLCVGDMVLTASGEMRPIRWLGHRRIDCQRHPRPCEVQPVRIAAHAFGQGRPERDLVVSPCHAICVDLMGEVLVPASALVNGTTIVREEVENVTYWHVELGSHDILLAENLPAESYLEMGNRDFFAESDIVALNASPDGPARTHADFCRPFAHEGALVEAIRVRLAGIGARLASKDNVTPSATRGRRGSPG